MTLENKSNVDNITIDIKTKKCNKCKRLLPATPVYFYRRKKGKYGLDSYCKECLREYFTLRNLKKNYGMSKNQFEQILKKQNNRCAICGQIFEDLFHPRNKESYTYQELAPRVDHNHKTGEIRGLLCDWCNRLIGFAHENTFLLVNAAKYLRKEI